MNYPLNTQGSALMHSNPGAEPAPLSAGSFCGGRCLFVGCSERKPTWKKGGYRKPDQSRVAILKAAGYDRDLTSVILDGIKSFRLDVVGKRVLLKPNLVEYERDTVINTHPAVIGAAIEAFLKLGAKEVKSRRRARPSPRHRRTFAGLWPLPISQGH